MLPLGFLINIYGPSPRYSPFAAHVAQAGHSGMEGDGGMIIIKGTLSWQVHTWLFDNWHLPHSPYFVIEWLVEPLSNEELGLDFRLSWLEIARKATVWQLDTSCISNWCR